MLSRATLELFRAAWLQDPALDFADPQISLINADLSGLPPTTVYYGEYETSPARMRSSVAAWPNSRSPPRCTRCPRASTPSSSPPDASPKWTRPSTRWVSGYAATSAAESLFVNPAP
jgi:acetyl esterase/lipase